MHDRASPIPVLLAAILAVSCDPNVTIQEEPAVEPPPANTVFDPTLVPGILHRYGQFLAPFADVVQAPDSATLWWGTDSSKLTRLGTNTIWVEKSTTFWIQARRAGSRGPKLDVNLAIRSQIDFATDDPQAQYADNAEFTRKLKNIHVLGFGWATTGSSVDYSKEIATNGLTGLNLKYALHGKYPSVGLGLQIGGAIDSLGPDRGKWGIDMDSVQSVEIKFDASALAASSTKLVLKVGSMDSVYSAACAKGICLQYRLPDASFAASMAIIKLDTFQYPDWSTVPDRPTTARADILRRSTGVMFSVETIADSVGVVSGSFKIFSVKFGSLEGAKPNGADKAP